jgi:2-phospho-L-lactate guanylyltransferase
MLGHVLNALRATRAIDHVAVVSPESDDLPAGVITLHDPGGGLNSALTSAAAQAYERGATRIVVVHADLPLLRPEEVSMLITAAGSTGFALAPDRKGTGTNALCAPADWGGTYQFGVGSFARHLVQARGRQTSSGIVRMPGLSFDVDEASDLRWWFACREEVSA